MTDSPLVLRDVSVTAPDGTERRTLLGGIDLEVAPGELLVITGGSGSGKSTLLAVAGLLRKPDSGRVVLGGVDATDGSRRTRTRLRRDTLAIVYQSANLIPSLTAREQLELVAHLRRERGSEVRRRADELLDHLGLAGGAADRLPANLSGGERQRIGVARALMAEPSVMLADEPTASLDPDLADEITGLLRRETTERGLATVVVTHDPEPLAVADRRLHLADGDLADRPLDEAGIRR